MRVDEVHREIVRADLERGVDEAKICKNIREDYTPKKTVRPSNLIKKDFVRNISKRFDFGANGQLHESDPISIDLFVEEQKETGEVIICSYKQQGKVDDAFPGMAKDDFLFAFMTAHQKELINKLESWDHVVICMDATHGLNDYGFQLISVLTKDGFGEGLPLAHMFCNRETYSALKHFIRGIFSECGKVKCNAFMSDDAIQYYQAWSSVMTDRGESAPPRSLCSWHVCRTFERGLLSHVKNIERRKNYFHHLKLIMTELDESKV